MEFDGRSFHQMSGKRHKLATLERTFKRKEHVEFGKFSGEGVQYKAKLIGVLEVPEARGEQMCQEALAELKMAIKAAGEHKLRIIIHISLEGMKLKDEKTGDCLYHHPVHKISFIAQDLTDPRAFGYVFGSPDLGHKFFGIKTEKAANQVVITMRDLFQVVFEMKKDEMDKAKHHMSFPTKFEPKPIHGFYTRDSYKKPDLCHKKEEPQNALADLLGLQFELDNLEFGINQLKKMSPQTEKTPVKSASDRKKEDPFGDSFKPSFEIPALQPPPPNTRHQKPNSITANTSSDIGTSSFDPFNIAPFKSSKSSVESSGPSTYSTFSSVDRYAPLAEISQTLANTSIFESPKFSSSKHPNVSQPVSDKKILQQWNNQEGKPLNEPLVRDPYGRVPIKHNDDPLRQVPQDRYGKLTYMQTLPARKTDVPKKFYQASSVDWSGFELPSDSNRRRNSHDKILDNIKDIRRNPSDNFYDRRFRNGGDNTSPKLEHREAKTLGRILDLKGPRGIKGFDRVPGLGNLGGMFSDLEVHHNAQKRPLGAPNFSNPNPLINQMGPNELSISGFGFSEKWGVQNKHLPKNDFETDWEAGKSFSKIASPNKLPPPMGKHSKTGLSNHWDGKTSKGLKVGFEEDWNLEINKAFQGGKINQENEAQARVTDFWDTNNSWDNCEAIDTTAEAGESAVLGKFSDNDFHETLTGHLDSVKTSKEKILGESLDDFADFKCFDPLSCFPPIEAVRNKSSDNPAPTVSNEDSSSASEGAPIPPTRSYSMEQEEKLESQIVSRPQSTVTDRSFTSTPDMAEEAPLPLAPDPPPRPSSNSQPPPLPPKRQQMQMFDKPYPKDEEEWKYDEVPSNRSEASPLSPPLPLPMRKSKVQSSVLRSSERVEFEVETSNGQFFSKGSLGLSPSQITSMSLKELAGKFPDMNMVTKEDKHSNTNEDSHSPPNNLEPSLTSPDTKKGFEADFSANNFSDSNGFDPKAEDLGQDIGESYFGSEITNGSEVKASSKVGSADSSPEIEKKSSKIMIKETKKAGSNEDSETEMSSYYSCSIGKDEEGDRYHSRQRPHSDERYFHRSHYISGQRLEGRKDESLAWAFTRYSDRPCKKEIHMSRTVKDVGVSNVLSSCSRSDATAEILKRPPKTSPKHGKEFEATSDPRFVDPWNVKDAECRDQPGSGYGHFPNEEDWQYSKSHTRPHVYDSPAYFARYQHPFRGYAEDFTRHPGYSPRGRMSRASPGAHRDMPEFYPDDHVMGPPYHSFGEVESLRSPYRYARENYDMYHCDHRYYGYYGTPWNMRPDYAECMSCSRADKNEESRPPPVYQDRRPKPPMSRARTSPFEDDFTLDRTQSDPWDPSGGSVSSYSCSGSRKDSDHSDKERIVSRSKSSLSKDSFGEPEKEQYCDNVFSPGRSDESWAVFDRHQTSGFDGDEAGDPWSETFPSEETNSSLQKSQITSAMKKSESLNIFHQEGDPFSDDPFFNSDAR